MDDQNLQSSLRNSTCDVIGDDTDNHPSNTTISVTRSNGDGSFPSSQDRMEEFWRTALADCESVPFPSFSPSHAQSSADKMVMRDVLGLGIHNEKLKPTIVCGALALVIGRITNSKDVLFCIVTSEETTIPTATTAPMRVKIPDKQPVKEYLEILQKQTRDMTPHARAGSEVISQLGSETVQACMFQTLLITQTGLSQKEFNSHLPYWRKRYSLIIEAGTEKFTVYFDESVLTLSMVEKLLQQIELVFYQLVNASDHDRISDVNFLTKQDLNDIWDWNSTVLAPIERCVHETIHDRVLVQPDATAICAWDGDLTYNELHHLAAQLGACLTNLGVGPEIIVPLCFEKSKWTTVAILGVLNAGAAFVLLDSSLPVNRLKSIVNQTAAKIMVSSRSNMPISSELGTQTIILDSDFTFNVESTSNPQPSPTSAIYVVFTSGSTGQPKGVVINHQNVTSAVYYQSRAWTLGPTSRVFDFASYSYDISICNALATLMSGACLCVPDDHSRWNKLAESITFFQANTVILTPSVARLLSPEQVPNLKSIVFIGEALKREDIYPWWNKAEVVNTYGPSECPCLSLSSLDPKTPEEATYIGRGLGQTTWVVDPENHNVLLPIGCIGELLLEGPLVGRGYLNDMAKTATAFIEDPTWLVNGTEGRPGRHGRVYKTGDLVRYNNDGNLVYLGRKDNQVKIRGQRVELSEVEHWVHECVGGTKQIVAEIITEEGSSPTLVAFVQFLDGAVAATPEQDLEVLPISTDKKEWLSSHLPSYMVPSVFFLIKNMPMTPTGKTDRKTLRMIGGAFFAKLVEKQTNGREAKQQPATETEIQIRNIWSQVLRIKVTHLIGLDDNFFGLGGDSISAMKVVAKARETGIKLTVADIFHHSNLRDLSKQSLVLDDTVVDEKPLPFSLLEGGLEPTSFAQDILSHRLSSTNISDAYPCTALQEGLISLALKRPGDYIVRTIFELSPEISLEKMKSAWNKVVRMMPILRSTIVHHGRFGLVQVVLNDDINWNMTSGLETYLDDDRKTPMELGNSLARYAIVYDGAAGRPRWLVWTTHHAIYDGWSMHQIIEALIQTYRGKQVDPGPPFSNFIKHIKDNKDEEKVASYWRKALEDYTGGSFPLPTRQPIPDTILKHEFPYPHIEQHLRDITISTMIRAAWAIVASQMSDFDDDVVFGAVVSGRNAPVANIEKMIAPTFATVPVRIKPIGSQTVSTYLQAIQKQAADMIPFEQTGLQNIANICPGTRQACAFQTLLIVQPDLVQTDNLFVGWQPDDDQLKFHTYALTIETQVSADMITASASFDSRLIEPWIGQNLLIRLGHVINQLAQADIVQKVAEVNTIPMGDLEQIWNWNHELPLPVSRCAHDLVDECGRTRPSATAICAWDGEFTYGELNQLTEQFGAYLISIGIGPEMIVPLCFEKSKWTTVAILSVLRTGAAFVLLDTSSLPETRLKTITDQSGSGIIVSSRYNEGLSLRLGKRVVTLDSNFVLNIHSVSLQSRSVDPNSAMYVVFTSGSTGIPKGTIITHQNMASSLYHQKYSLGLGAETRLFDFASYSFDVSIYNIFITLTSGGCICVPNDGTRINDLADTMVLLEANTAILTPSVARLLSPEKLPLLRTIVFAGEALCAEDTTRWENALVINAYGPSECTPVSTLNLDPLAKHDVGIGKGLGLVTWVVHPEDHDVILPLGCTGELLLEGPLVGRGYLNDPDKTAVLYVEDPPWLLKGTGTEDAEDKLGRRGRLYKTGDLVRYNSDGSLAYIGRKDSQVKIRGQRVELGEVEYWVRKCGYIPEMKHVVAEVIIPHGPNAKPTLAAFLQMSEDTEMLGEMVDQGIVSLAKQLSVSTPAEDWLASHLPSYMIPSVFFTMQRLPMLPTGKIDRRKLREIGGLFSTKIDARKPKPQPTTDAEHQMRELWAKVLGLDSTRIGLDDSFIRLGGDSISAMSLVGEARKTGIQLSVADVFSYPKLESLVQQCSVPTYEDNGEKIHSYSLLGVGMDAVVLLHGLTHDSELNAATIVDAYPCTPLQEGIMSLSAKRPGDYIMQATMELSPETNLESLCTAWDSVVRSMAILRTTIIQNDDFGLVQVVAQHERIRWINATNLEHYLEEDRKMPMGLGCSFTRYAVISDTVGARWFVWTVHHALYDGWSMGLILKAVVRAYQGKSVNPGPPFTRFIKQIRDLNIEKTANYWRAALQGYQGTPFPPLLGSTQQPVADQAAEHRFPWPQERHLLDITTSTIIRAAWALIIGQMTNSSDVVFGAVVSGRNAPVPGVEAIAAPTFAAIPVRIKLGNQTVVGYLHEVQQQATGMIPFEQTGLHQIAATCGEAKQACMFQTQLVIQPKEEAYEMTDSIGRWKADDRRQQFSSYGLNILLQQGADEIVVSAAFDSNLIDTWTVDLLLKRLEHVMKQLTLTEDGGQEVTDVSRNIPPGDLDQIWKWNVQVPAPVKKCVHNMIQERVLAQPTAPAVCAWDGELMYSELNSFATGLAGRLVALGVGSGSVVPLCFEKSVWTPVAVLGVLKSGAAFVLLDPSLPVHRLRSIVTQVNSTVVVSSNANEGLVLQLSLSVLCIDRLSLTYMLDESNGRLLPDCSPDTTACIVFSSGSTGIPKGAALSHINASSSVSIQTKLIGCTADTRLFDFASYGFDVAIFNIFMTLIVGGCLCIPSDQERKDNLMATMTSLRTDLAILTPSVSRLLIPDQLPHFRVLVSAGEVLRITDVKRWWGKVKIINTYGPSECTCISTAEVNPQTPEEAIRIGKGVGQVTWVVDPEDHNILMPLGCVGELLLEGPLVGVGYINDPERTAASFINDTLWLPKDERCGRLYKSGDLVRYNEDGSLSYVGRKDNQIKIRGQRIDLGEVEHWVQGCMPTIKQVVAEIILPLGDELSPVLAAFVQLNGYDGSAETTDRAVAPKMMAITPDAEDWLASHLPSYMVPSLFFAMRELPISHNGKTDRVAIREIGGSFSVNELAEMRTGRSELKQQPTTKFEHHIRDIWANVLKLRKTSIGMDDNFFRLGGDSIAAMKVVAEARKIGIELTVAHIFRSPKLCDLSREATLKSRDDFASIKPDLSSTEQVQSFAQERLWFLEQLHPGLEWYLAPWVVRLRGPLRLDALHMALASLEKRHETLRTVFGVHNGVNMQYVLPFEARELRVVKVQSDELEQKLRDDQSILFDLEKEPGWRPTVYQIGREDHVLSIMMHHIIFDGWSIDVLRRELTTFYSAALCHQDPLANADALPIQYRDYSYWQRQSSHQVAHERQLDYWVRQLDTSRPAAFLCDQHRPATLSGRAGIQEFNIEGSLYRDLQEFCSVLGVTPFVVLLATFNVTHHRLTGASDATVGVANANRDRWEVRDLIGFFVNLQCIRASVHDESFEDMVRQVNTTTTESFANQDVPFERIVSKLNRERDISRHPLVQVVFALHSQVDLGMFSFEGVKTELVESAPTTRFDLEFHLYQREQALSGNLLFSTDLYNSKTIDNILLIFMKTLRDGLNEPSARVASLPLFDKDDYSVLNNMGLIKVNETRYPRNSSVIDVFCQQVALCPESVAVKDDSSQLTYAELNAKSDIVAQWLLRRLFAAETVVGVLATRCCHTIVSLIGILKANLAYLPLDPKIPSERLEVIMESIPNTKLILLGFEIQRPALKRQDIDLVYISDILCEQTLSNNGVHGFVAPSANSLAYVIFTSGSTGRPKGVMVEHRGIVRLARQNNMVEYFPISPVVAHISSISFDIATWEIYSCLLNGGTLICVDTGSLLDFTILSKLCACEQVQVMTITPALLKQYLAHCPAIISSLQALYVGGDRLDEADMALANSLVRGNVINGYGPTENTVASTVYRLLQNDHNVNGVPIGRALSNSGAYVMDPNQCLVPLGVLGELVVTGDGLARGYIDPKQNLNRFVTIKIGQDVVRAYRTGDYVRYCPVRGQLEFFGRMDSQVKIRGHRVELGEIEHTLRADEKVADAVAVLQLDDNNAARLNSFVIMSQVDDEESELLQVKQWEERFDGDVYVPLHNMSPADIGRDFIGWTSMYDGQDIDKMEMDEWLDDTLKSIIDSSPVDHLLEIGTGSGMILFSLMDKFTSYIGLEPSAQAVSSVVRTSESILTLANKVKMYKATATDINCLKAGSASPEMAIINSVVQYFPSQDYLFKVIESLAQLPGMRTIFFGDIRSLPLHRQFLAGRALHVGGEKSLPRDIQNIMADMEQAEPELLVDPGFFTSLPSRLRGFVEHVEILPKKMRATNELSRYRFAAVIHINTDGKNRLKEEIRQIDHDSWINFARQGLDSESLSRLLQRSVSEIVAVSNIPYSKIVFERELLDTVERKVTENAEWVALARQRAETYSALSSIDLEALAEQEGYRVEVSWARQYSQRGAFDAIFHRIQPVRGKGRVMFNFPEDHEGRPLQYLSSHPLRQQQVRKTKTRLMKMIKSKLPSYMVPQTIFILDQFPITTQGKVDRQALAKIAKDQSAVLYSKRQATSMSAAERQMQGIWAEVLGLDLNYIGLDDNFFRLGGDSITAMKVVGEARKMGITINVADIFRSDTLERLCQSQGKNTTTKQQYQNWRQSKYEMVDPALKAAIVGQITNVHTNILPEEIADVLPATNFQSKCVAEGIASGLFIFYMFLDLPIDFDVTSLERGCSLTMERFSILRALFIHLRGSTWQVFLRQLRQKLTIQDVIRSLDESFHEFCVKDQQNMSPTEPPISFVLLRRKGQGLRFVLRISHAQYDGVCIPAIFRSIFHSSQTMSHLNAPSFIEFLSYVSHMQPQSLAYWKKLLKGSTHTAITSLLGSPAGLHNGRHHVIRAEAEAVLPKLPNKITVATLISSAWALLLSYLTGKEDIVYGHVIAGRNAEIEQVEEVVGPCVNIIPVRVLFSDYVTAEELLNSVQEQFVAVGEADSLGFDDIIKHCTDWPSGAKLESIIQHQNIDEHPDIAYRGGKSQIGFFNNPERGPSSTPIDIVSYLQDSHLRIVLLSGSHVIAKGTADALVSGLIRIVGSMANDVDLPLRSYMKTIKLGF